MLECMLEHLWLTADIFIYISLVFLHFAKSLKHLIMHLKNKTEHISFFMRISKRGEYPLRTDTFNKSSKKNTI